VSRIHERIGIGFGLSDRLISFKFDEPVPGDTRAIGPGVAAGISILMRF